MIDQESVPSRSETTETAIDSPVGLLRLRVTGDKVIGLAWYRQGETVLGPGSDDDDRNPLVAEVKRQLSAYFAGELRNFDLPLAPAGSGFQQRVWSEMRTIPYGHTMTYGALAQRTGSVARAIGGACGANPIPIFIPCHRVLAGGGKLGGFSGGLGVESKRALLEHEGVLPPSLGL